MKNITILFFLFLTTLPVYSNEPTRAQRTAIENLPEAQRKAIEELEAEIQNNKRLYQNRPRTRHAFPLTAENKNPINIYADICYQKILSIANLNILKGATEGAASVYFEVHPTGNVGNIEIIRSSGNPATDETIRQAILLAAPFNAFSEEIKKQAEVITMVRRFTFKKGK